MSKPGRDFVLKCTTPNTFTTSSVLQTTSARSPCPIAEEPLTPKGSPPWIIWRVFSWLKFLRLQYTHEFLDDTMKDCSVVVAWVFVQYTNLEAIIKWSAPFRAWVMKFSTVLGASSGKSCTEISPLVVWIVQRLAEGRFFSSTGTATVCSSLVGLSLNTSRSPLLSLHHGHVNTCKANIYDERYALFVTASEQIESLLLVCCSKEVRVPRCFVL